MSAAKETSVFAVPAELKLYTYSTTDNIWSVVSASFVDTNERLIYGDLSDDTGFIAVGVQAQFNSVLGANSPGPQTIAALVQVIPEPCMGITALAAAAGAVSLRRRRYGKSYVLHADG